jgi:hypothetical protein
MSRYTSPGRMTPSKKVTIHMNTIFRTHVNTYEEIEKQLHTKPLFFDKIFNSETFIKY